MGTLSCLRNILSISRVFDAIAGPFRVPQPLLYVLTAISLLDDDGDDEHVEENFEDMASELPPFSRRPSMMASFENLVALANYQEALRDARKMVWRDRGEPTAELHTLMECLEHAGRGGLRE